MIHWKVSAISFAVGAIATVGFVWLRSRRSGAAETKPELGERKEIPFDAEETARLDALHDVGDQASELDLDEAIDVEPTELEPIEMRSFDEEIAERATGGERYDAVDPEEVGAEFLQRATEASVDSTPGADPQLPADLDIAAELPVGSVDAEGTTELHPPVHPAGAPAELSPTEEELEQRRLAREEHAGSGKPHE